MNKFLSFRSARTTHLFSGTFKEFNRTNIVHTWRFASNHTVSDSLKFSDWKKSDSSTKNTLTLQNKLYGTGLKERRKLEGSSFEELIRSSHPIKNDKKRTRNYGKPVRKPTPDPTQFTIEKPGSEKKNLSPNQLLAREERRLVRKLEKIRSNEKTNTQAPEVTNTNTNVNINTHTHTNHPTESLSEFTIEKITHTEPSLQEDSERTKYTRRKLIIE
ncbi:hypothetical protein K7432_001357 [Basidiobolus ranarum]|uniref:Uncharacterized protein n=1 Tax=Basidiobolus ranarum TaxID=34480 RepID=A0ABR2W9R4_9FUNG